jgi:hypothetical protein
LSQVVSQLLTHQASRYPAMVWARSALAFVDDGKAWNGLASSGVVFLNGGAAASRSAPMARVERGHIVETATEARGGVPGKPVLYMLIAGTTGVIVLFAVVYLVLFSH